MSDERHSATQTPVSARRGERDLGRTEFGDVSEVTKHDIRLAAFGSTEEANVAVGTAMSFGDYDAEVSAILISVQNDLFDLAADLSAPYDRPSDANPVRITEQHIAWVDRAYKHFGAALKPVEGYVLPGGTVAASLLFNARVAVRRAERSTLSAMAEHPGSINPLVARYLNAASSLLFVLARTHNNELGDTEWKPLASITTAPLGGGRTG